MPLKHRRRIPVTKIFWHKHFSIKFDLKEITFSVLSVYLTELKRSRFREQKIKQHCIARKHLPRQHTVHPLASGWAIRHQSHQLHNPTICEA